MNVLVPRSRLPSSIDIQGKVVEEVRNTDVVGSALGSNWKRLYPTKILSAKKSEQLYGCNHLPAYMVKPLLSCSMSREDGRTEECIWNCGDGGIVWEAERISQAVEGELVQSGDPGSICTDTRTINKGQWFLALVGPNFDGHEFSQQALDRGCAGVIGRYVDSDWPRGFIRVGCPLQALHMLAVYVRKSYRGPVVGITGSTGKTTARAMTSLALKSLGYIHQTAGNLNNHIGVPLTLLKLPSTASACVLEMGMSAPGEIQFLAEIAEPSVRVLLNVGPAHMENFETLEDVGAAKGELLSSAKPGDVCILNADDPLVMSLILPPSVQVIFFGRQTGCHVKLVEAHVTKGGHCVSVVLEQSIHEDIYTVKYSSGSQIFESLRVASRRSIVPGDGDRSQVEFEISSPGLHLALNACAAAAVAVALSIPLDIVSKSLIEFSPVGMRSKLEEVGDIQLINDTYNSNPMSLESALRSLSCMEGNGRKVAFLGDMLELGTVTAGAHNDALLLCKELQVDFVGLVGPCFSEAARSLGLTRDNMVICGNSKALASLLHEILQPGDIVLIKGSRGMKMEVVACAIKDWNISR